VALTDTAVLHYAYAEFEEARGGIKEAKGVYETLISNDSTANALAYIQVSGLHMSVLLSCWVISSLPITKVSVSHHSS
jgi:hypothetical protein